jgi:electron transport complex protein RnfB
MIMEISIMGCLALLIGFGLVWASNKFEEKPDPTFDRVADTLPGANCGGCGFAGCKEYARAVINNPSLIGRCRPGGKDVAKKLSNILHHTVQFDKRFSVIRCKGGDNCEDKADYHGIKTCESAVMVSKGQKSCIYGCMGFGDCIRACKFDAMKMGTKGYPIIDPEKCTSCGKCVAACPKCIPKIQKKRKVRFVSVDCVSEDPGKKVGKFCHSGCIACGSCEKVCPKKAIVVKDNLAQIDYDKCIGCGKCVEVCPKHVISFIKV